MAENNHFSLPSVYIRSSGTCVSKWDLILAYKISRSAAVSKMCFIETTIKSGCAGICPIHFLIIILRKKDMLFLIAFQRSPIYAVSKVQISRDLLKINATYQFLLHTDYLVYRGQTRTRQRNKHNLYWKLVRRLVEKQMLRKASRYMRPHLVRRMQEKITHKNS